MTAKPLPEWPADAQVRYHEVMAKLLEWMPLDKAEAEAKRRVRAEYARMRGGGRHGQG